MPIAHRSGTGKKPSGGKYTQHRSKRQYESGSQATMTEVGKTYVKKVRTRGGNTKTRAIRTESVNLFDPRTKKFATVKVARVIENPANRNFARRNILTKGAVVETEKGKAKITSRPGQSGSVTAVLI